jgi:hypothetical protein
MMLLTVLFSGVNSALLILLLALYAKIVFRTKAVHAIGLSLFALLLLGQNLLSLYSYIDMQSFFDPAVVPYLLVIGGLELASLIAIVGVTI